MLGGNQSWFPQWVHDYLNDLKAGVPLMFKVDCGACEFIKKAVPTSFVTVVVILGSVLLIGLVTSYLLGELKQKRWKLKLTSTRWAQDSWAYQWISRLNRLRVLLQLCLNSLIIITLPQKKYCTEERVLRRGQGTFLGMMLAVHAWTGCRRGHTAPIKRGNPPFSLIGLFQVSWVGGMFNSLVAGGQRWRMKGNAH
jgi:hypothetical protein